jgi:hypothetical protein
MPLHIEVTVLGDYFESGAWLTDAERQANAAAAGA